MLSWTLPCEMAAYTAQAVIEAHAGESETLEQDVDAAARHLRLQVHARGSTTTVCAAALRIVLQAAACWLSTE